MRNTLNPALLPSRGYVNIPLIGQFGSGIETNFLSVKNFLYPSADGNGMVTFMNSEVSSSEFLSRLADNNYICGGMSMNLLGLGLYTKHGFLSFGFDMKVSIDGNIPKDLFALAKSTSTGTYDISNLGAEVSLYNQLSVGYTLPIGNNLQIGAKIKLLGGLARAHVNVEQLSCSLSAQEWRADASVLVEGNIVGMNFDNLHGRTDVKTDQLEDMISSDSIDFKRIRNFGGAIDLGVEMKLLDEHINLSAAVTDLGFIKWNAASGFSARSSDMNYSFAGYDFDKEEFTVNDTEDMTLDFSGSQSTTKRLVANMNIGAEYKLLHNKIGIGLLSQTKFGTSSTYTDITLSANFRPLSWLSVSLSNSLLHSSLGVFGFGLNMHPSWINFFAGIDYIGLKFGTVNSDNGKGWILLPINQNSFMFNFGLAIPLGQSKW